MRICSVEGCGRKHNDHGLCNKHSSQIKRFGRVVSRTTKDKNHFIEENDFIKMEVYNIKCEVIGYVLFSKCDKHLTEFKWHKDSGGYASANGLGRMHRVVLNKKVRADKYVDHINGDKLDNRRSNLRLVTKEQNTWNKFSLGVELRAGWRTRIKYKKIDIYLGCYKNFLIAVAVRTSAEKILHKEYSFRNKVKFINALLSIA